MGMTYEYFGVPKGHGVGDVCNIGVNSWDFLLASNLARLLLLLSLLRIHERVRIFKGNWVILVRAQHLIMVVMSNLWGCYVWEEEWHM